MQQCDNDELARVIGGYTRTDKNGTYSQSSSDSCYQAMERAAADKYPDTRTWLGRLFGTMDENAGRRADWLRDAASTCSCTPNG